ncbi:hypothetical protein AGDE_01636 [Angomonas deanei]|nr:hypothetical protein AGDE_01636 [Angomonas deanei]|eukprot:EPY42287.1 hypothetical protein AGDE_01636 [Angomonas deanei]
MPTIRNIFSQRGYLQERQEAGLHIINELQRFRLLVCCLFCSMGVSMVYTFELFTTEFSNKFGLGAGDQSTISTVGVAFCYFVVPYALIYEKMGPTPLLMFGAVCAFVGLLGLALIFYEKIPGDLVIICVFYAIMNTCAGLFDASSVVTLQSVFPRNRGPILGLAKVMTGLGSSVFATIKGNLFPHDVSGFIFFLMAFAIVVALVSIFTVTLPPYEVNWWRGRGKTEEEKEIMRSLTAVYYSKSAPMRRLAAGYVVGICLVVFFAVSAPVVAYVHVSQEASYAIGAITIVLLLCFFVMTLPIKCLGGVDEISPAAMQADHAAPLDEERQATEDNVYEPSELMTQDGEKKAGLQTKQSTDDIVKQKRANEQADVDDDVEAEGAATSTMVNPYAEYVEDIQHAYTDPRYPGDFFANLRRPDIYCIYLGFILQGAIGVIVMYNASTILVAPRTWGATAGPRRVVGPVHVLRSVGVGSSVVRPLVRRSFGFPFGPVPLERPLRPVNGQPTEGY